MIKNVKQLMAATERKVRNEKYTNNTKNAKRYWSDWF